MPKTTLVFAAIVLAGLLGINIGAYFDGLTFSKSWVYPMAFVPVILLSALCFVVTFFVTFISVLRRKQGLKLLLAAAVTPFLAYAIPSLPLPGFADGMRVAVAKKLERKRLINFLKPPKRSLTSGSKAATLCGCQIQILQSFRPKTVKFTSLKEIYPDALSMSDWPATVEVAADKVVIQYGGALTKHFGYAIVDDDACQRTAFGS
ncbi:MAG: hypothetical protein R3C58_07120 [Parvularculaceae bacterium]